MKIEIINSKIINGISIKTNNEIEKTSHGKIPKLWENYRKTFFPVLPKNSITYGLYYNYESDANGEYCVLTGSDSIEKSDKAQSLKIEAGKYLVFSKKGKMPDIIIEVWQEVWQYFNPESKYQRAYKTDFERYESIDEIKLYIGIL